MGNLVLMAVCEGGYELPGKIPDPDKGKRPFPLDFLFKGAEITKLKYYKKAIDFCKNIIHANYVWMVE
jgi:hypothetical protein